MEKHTKLRGLLALKQKKGKERERRRGKFEWWKGGDGRMCIYKRRGGISKILKEICHRDMIGGRK